MAKTKRAKSSNSGRHPIVTLMVYCAMAIVVTAFVVGLHVQSGVALIPSVLLGIVLFLVVGSCEFVIGRARQASGMIRRIEDIEAALADVLRESEALGQRSATDAQFARHVTDLNSRLATLERLAQEYAEQVDHSQNAVQQDPQQMAAYAAEMQRLGIDLDRLDSRVEAVIGQIQSDNREWQGQITSELKLLETLVKQVAERLPVETSVPRAPMPVMAEPQAAPPQIAEPPIAATSDISPPAVDPLVAVAEAATQRAAEPVAQAAEPLHSAEAEAPVQMEPDLETEASVVPPAPPASQAEEEMIVAETSGGDLTVLDAVRRSIEANRIDLYLQPIVTLPQRKVRFYEALTRLRDDGGELIMPGAYLQIAEQSGMMPLIDNIMLFRSVQVLRRLGERSSARGVFCNISVHSLVDAEFFPEFISFMEQNRSLADSLTFEFSQQMINACGPIEQESLQALASLGFRFSLDHVQDLDVDFRELHERNFRFVKVDADVFLNRMSEAGARIHPADMRAYLERFGLELIIEKVEDERSLTNVLDYDIGLAQGYLFSEPRPVRPEVYGSEEDAEAA